MLPQLPLLKIGGVRAEKTSQSSSLVFLMLKGRGASSLIKDIVGEVKDSPRLSQDHLAPTLTRATCTLSQVRQVNEAVRIGMSDAECLMNFK